MAEQVAVDVVDEVHIKALEDQADICQEDETSDLLDGRDELPEACVSEESLPDVFFEPARKEKKKSEYPGTRHVVDVGYMFSHLNLKFACHNPIMRCTLDQVHLLSTERKGLQLRFTFQCKMCLEKHCISSEPEESNILSLNESAVAAAVSVGIGYLQSKEMFNAMNIPFMSYGTYQRHHDKIASAFDKAAAKAMKVAGEEEKRLAIK